MMTSKEVNFTTAPAPAAPQERFTRRGATLTHLSEKKPPSARQIVLPRIAARRLAGLVTAGKRVVAQHECRTMASNILRRAKTEHWSQRSTEENTGLSHRTLTRLARGEGRNLNAWLPKLRAAVAKLMDLQP